MNTDRLVARTVMVRDPADGLVNGLARCHGVGPSTHGETVRPAEHIFKPSDAQPVRLWNHKRYMDRLVIAGDGAVRVVTCGHDSDLVWDTDSTYRRGRLRARIRRQTASVSRSYRVGVGRAVVGNREARLRLSGCSRL